MRKLLLGLALAALTGGCCWDRDLGQLIMVEADDGLRLRGEGSAGRLRYHAREWSARSEGNGSSAHEL
jgi:hypothetical protein